MVAVSPRESSDARLARIEEGMVSLHGKMDAQHHQKMEILKPLISQVSKHHDSIVTLKRDRWWLGTLAGLAITVAGWVFFNK